MRGLVPVLFILLLMSVSCQKETQGESPASEKQAREKTVVKKTPEAASDAKELCRLFEPPWGEENWRDWAMANREAAESWFVETPMKMKKADLSVIPRCTHLKSMFVGFSALEDLTPFAKLTGLKSLDLRFSNKIADLSPLKDLNGLEFLSIWGTAVTDLSPIVHLPELRRIDAKMGKISDLKDLPRFPKLEWIDLLQCPVTDVRPLAKLKNLHEVRLCSTQVTDITPLLPLAKQITYLDLCNTPFRDFKLLKSFPNLTYFQAWGLPFGDLSVLNGMTEMETLDLSNAKVDSLLPLKGMKKLKKLILVGVNPKESELAVLKKEIPDVEIVLTLD